MYEEIKITNKDMLPLLYWCFLKYKFDPSSRQGIGGREDKIGGFIDRFSNQSINWLLFDNILKEKSFSVDRDFFFYKDRSAKNSPDLIGLKKKDSSVIPLSMFNKTKWEMIDGMPFVEIKALRKNQNLLSLDIDQYDKNHFYGFVETDFDDNYLLNFFEDNIFNLSNEMLMSQRYIIDNSQNIIIEPFKEDNSLRRLEKNKIVGTMRLLGFYKGSEISNFSKRYDSQEKFKYLSSVIPVDFEEIPSSQTKVIIKETSKNSIYHYVPKNDQKSHLPFYISVKDFEIYSREQQTVGFMYIYVKESCFINNFSVNEGFHKLQFKPMDRNKKNSEYFTHKFIFDVKDNSQFNAPHNSTDELIGLLENIANSG